MQKWKLKSWKPLNLNQELWVLPYLYLFLVTDCIQTALHKAFLDSMIKDQHSEGDTSVEETGF